jgi:hypothetical protein
MTKCETHDEHITNQTLESPVEVLAPGVTFEHCTFISKDPQHTLLTTGERTRVHDCDFRGDFLVGGRRGIAVNSAGVVITSSRFRDLHHAQDAACIAGWDGTKDLLVEDCFGESSGENIIFGGADCQGEDRIPQDITIRRCTLTKPQHWKDKPNGCTVKNLFELKNAKRVRVEACNFAQSWIDGQDGFGWVFTVRNQDGGNPYACIEDDAFISCVMRSVVSGIQILGTDYTHPSGLLKRLTFEKCQIEYLNGNGIQLGNGAEGIGIDHCNFWSATNGKWLAFNNPARPITGLTISNSDANEGMYGIHGDDTSPGQPTLDVYSPTAVFANVNLWRGPSGANYPYPAGITVY